MIRTYNSKIIGFYQIALAIMGTAILGTLAYFWQLGFLDGSRAKNLHQVSYILEKHEAKPEINRVRELVEIEDYKLALEKIKEIEKEFSKVDLQIKTEEFEKLKAEFQKLKTSTTNLLSFQKTNQVLNVFNTKMDKFYDYVRENRWKTLTRMSERVYSVTRSGVKLSNIDNVIKDVDRDFQSMIRITEGSVLERKDKSEIVSRIKNLQIEMTMLKKYIDELDFFKQLHVDTETALKSWMKTVSPELTLQKLKVEQIGKFFIIGLGGLFALAMILLGLSIPYSNWMNRKEQKKLEKDIELLVSERIIEADKSVVFDGSSQDFQDYCEKMSRYVNKRMSMGAIFQEALPLSSILLDENLQVIWSNKFFCEDWMIDEDEMKKDYMTWDFLNKLTNLGEEDPVIEALKHGVAGIYQIQVKPSDDLTARPYEMFVSPVEYQGQRRVQLFFYDLRSLEQTIKDQAQSLINPIKTNLKRLKENNFVVNEETKYDFMVAGIKDVYQLFVDNHEKIETEKSSLIDQIEIMSAEVERLEGDIGFVKEKLILNLETGKGSIQDLKVFKENVIGLSSESREYDRLVRKGLEVINANVTALSNSRNRVDGLRKFVEEVYHSVPQYSEQKQEIKRLKQQLSENLNRSLSAMKNKGSNESLQKLKDSFVDLEKKLSQLEISLSKADMVLSSGRNLVEASATEYESEQIHFAQSEFKTMQKSAQSSLEKVEKNETMIISSLKHLFEGTKSQLSHSNDAASRIQS